jgi:hypothetical protein
MTMDRAEYVCAIRDLDYAPHGLIKKGELGRVVAHSGPGLRVMWEKPHFDDDWHNTSTVHEYDIDAVKRVGRPVWLRRSHQVALFFVMVGLPFVVWLTLPGFGHHNLSTVRGATAERIYVKHAPLFIYRIVHEPSGIICIITYERIQDRELREVTRRRLHSQEEIEAELHRLRRIEGARPS